MNVLKRDIFVSYTSKKIAETLRAQIWYVEREKKKSCLKKLASLAHKAMAMVILKSNIFHITSMHVSI